MRDEHVIDLRLFRIWMKASQSFFKNIDDDIESYGIKREHFVLLELLYSKGSHPVQKISETLSIPSGSITYVVDKLTEKGLVERQRSERDKRVCSIALTAAGKELFDAIFPKHIEAISQHLSFIDTDEKEQLMSLLKKVGLANAKSSSFDFL